MKQSTLDALNRYVKHGIQPGDFLYAVLTNDLFGAFGHADWENLRAMYEIVSYLYNDTPANCWGSPAIVRAWMECTTLAREKRELAKAKGGA